jgi:hypothetical protein
MKRPGRGSFDTRALEIAVTAVAVFLGADAVRAAFGPLWKNLGLLLGL